MKAAIMPDSLFRLQVATALSDRRQMLLRIGISALLALPFIVIAMPARAQASGIAMVVLFTSFFGAAVSHTQLRHDLRLARLMLLPTRRWVLWLDLVLSSAFTRLAPALAVVSGFVLINARDVTPVALIDLAGLLCGTLFLLTLLGIGIGRLAHSNGEVHLLGALTAAILAFASGVAPLPDRLAWWKTTLSWNPIARLLATLEGLAVGSVDVPTAELIVSSTILAAVVVATTFRWVSNPKSTLGDRQDDSGHRA